MGFGFESKGVIWIDYNQMLDMSLRTNGLKTTYTKIREKDIDFPDKTEVSGAFSSIISYVYSEARTLELDYEAKQIAIYLKGHNLNSITHEDGHTFTLDAIIEEFTNS